MKRFIKDFFIFSLVSSLILGLFFLVGFELLPFRVMPNIKYIGEGYGFSDIRFKEVDTLNDIDILFLGSSHAYRGFDTRNFDSIGFRAFNLGSSAQTHDQTQILLKRYLKELNPKLVVYEVFPNVFKNSGIESNLDLINNDIVDYLNFKSALRVNNIQVYQTLAHAYYKQKFKSQNKIKSYTRSNDTYIKGGYVEKAIKPKYTHSTSRKGWELNELQKSSFKQNIEMFNSENIKYILVFAPVSSSYYESIDLKKFNNFIRSYGNYYDFNRISNMNDSLHFYDPHHLTQEGVDKFNTDFIHILKDHVLIK
jgi:hypothetical protein